MDAVIDFLIKNSYQEQTVDNEYRTFVKSKNLCSIDVNKNEIVFVSDSGDWLHLPCNLYALIGALIHFREISVDYKS